MTGPYGLKSTRRASTANIANHREYRQRKSQESIVGANRRPNVAASWEKLSEETPMADTAIVTASGISRAASTIALSDDEPTKGSIRDTKIPVESWP
jgi:hypothetical protein